VSFAWRYLVRRVLVSVVLLWLLSVITFAIYYTVPQEPANFVLGIRGTVAQKATPAQLRHARHLLGVDRPITTQYGKFVWRALHGNFGISWQTLSFDPNANLVGAHVGASVVRAAAVTGWLALGGLVLVLLLSIPAATLAASRVGSWLDKTLLSVTLIGISTHPIVIGVILQTFVGNRWHITPPGGYCGLTARTPIVLQQWDTHPQTCGGFADWASHMVLPWITFALFFIALYMRIVRVRLLDVLDADYVRAARAKGASEFRVLRRHALPNTILPVVTMLAMDIGTAVGVAVYVETVYQLPGLGRLTLGALAGDAGFDLPVIIAVVMVVGTAIILLNLLADMVLALVDPRVEARGVRRAHATAGVV
jgi:peptide/nickel transport system permease protein